MPTSEPGRGQVRSARLVRILAAMADGQQPAPAHLCTIAAQIVQVDGAAVMVEGSDHRAPLCSSDVVAAQIAELGVTLGEGPGVDAHHNGSPVAEPDLVRPRDPRWPNFTPLAVQAGLAAIFSFPLRVGGVHLGALTLHQMESGHLSDEQHADALVMANVVVHTVLAHQAGVPAGLLATELEVLGSSQAEVHQASGMVSVQLGVSVAEALVRLRGHAYASDRGLREVAVDVVNGTLRLDH